MPRAALGGQGHLPVAAGLLAEGEEGVAAALLDAQT